MPRRRSTSCGVPYEKHIVSAHRTPKWMAEFAEGAEARGLEVIIAGAGGAAHLPGMVAAHTVLPVLGVPVQSAALQGLDSLLSIVQMPGGVPVATLAIGKAGATQRRTAGRRPSSPPAARAARQAARLPRRADRRPCAKTRCREPDHPARRHARRARQRPARPHVRHRGAPHGLPRPHALARPSTRPPARWPTSRSTPPTTTSTPSARSPAASTSSPSSSRTSRPPPPTPPPRSRRCGPSGHALHVTQHRAREKAFLAAQGLSRHAVRVGGVARRADDGGAAASALPAILKTAGFGYDGKGQHRLTSPLDDRAACGRSSATRRRCSRSVRRLRARVLGGGRPRPRRRVRALRRDRERATATTFSTSRWRRPACRRPRSTEADRRHAGHPGRTGPRRRAVRRVLPDRPTAACSSTSSPRGRTTPAT